MVMSERSSGESDLQSFIHFFILIQSIVLFFGEVLGGNWGKFGVF